MVHAYDWDRVGSDDFLGEAVINFATELHSEGAGWHSAPSVVTGSVRFNDPRRRVSNDDIVRSVQETLKKDFTSAIDAQGRLQLNVFGEIQFTLLYHPAAT